MGLGKQMAFALAEFGANVVLAARKVERCELAAAEIREKYAVKTAALTCDISEEEDIFALINQTTEIFGRLDILVNNAGITWGAPAAEYPTDKWRQILDTNLTGCFIASREAFRVMEKQGSGKIINNASVMGLVGVHTEIMDAVAYNACKGAVINMTKDLAVKWASSGVNVNAIAPGWFPTHMAEKIIEMRRDLFLSNIPAGRFGNEEDLKGAVVYLASRASDYVHGHVLTVDGGWCAH